MILKTNTNDSKMTNELNKYLLAYPLIERKL